MCASDKSIVTLQKQVLEEKIRLKVRRKGKERKG